MTVLLEHLQLLVSMYDKKNVNFHDPELEFLFESTTEEVDFSSIKNNSTTNLTLTLNESLEIDIRIPLGYPHSESLSGNCRVKHNSSAESKLNQNIRSRLNSINTNNSQLDLFNFIDFCREQLEIILSSSESSDQAQVAKVGEEKEARIWIYSHHIYNKGKRKFVIDSADELKLRGFLCSGKPGFICVEGQEADCDDFWTRIRQLTWQKISLILKECPIDTHSFSESEGFFEISTDKSKFIKYLEDKNLSSVIKDYLGF